jgi:aromatic-L-amino-acid decarboxylase
LLTEAVVQDGRFFLSEAQIDGETWLRPCFTNFRTTREDVDDLFEVLEEVAKSINL